MINRPEDEEVNPHHSPQPVPCFEATSATMQRPWLSLWFGRGTSPLSSRGP